VKIGDLVIYDAEHRGGEPGCTYDVPGIVVDFDLDSSDNDILVVQWLDWPAGNFANENPEVLEVFSEAR